MTRFFRDNSFWIVFFLLFIALWLSLQMADGGFRLPTISWGGKHVP